MHVDRLPSPEGILFALDLQEILQHLALVLGKLWLQLHLYNASVLFRNIDIEDIALMDLAPHRGAVDGYGDLLADGCRSLVLIMSLDSLYHAHIGTVLSHEIDLSPYYPTDDLDAYHSRLGLAEDTVRQNSHSTRPDDGFQALLFYLHLLVFDPLLIVLNDRIDDLAGKDGHIGLLDLSDGIGQDIHIETHDGRKQRIIDGSGLNYIPS